MSCDDVFGADWLALREPVDHRSRSARLLAPLVHAWRTHGWSRVLDVGSGTGSNLRYLTSSLPGPQSWTLLDKDGDLLERFEPPTDERVRTVRCQQGDLLDAGLRDAASADLVTGSALLDLVSEAWLRRLVQVCFAASCGVHFALTYDGGIEWTTGDGAKRPEEAERECQADSELVRRAVNAHQRRDKGLGPALGPTAGPAAEAALRAAGYDTWLHDSPWRLGPRDAELALALVDGWEQAALEQVIDSSSVEHLGPPDSARRIRAWARNRRRIIADGAFGLTVGHVDLLALPPETD